jgi:hypothetical protein
MDVNPINRMGFLSSATFSAHKLVIGKIVTGVLKEQTAVFHSKRNTRFNERLMTLSGYG